MNYEEKAIRLMFEDRLKEVLANAILKTVFENKILPYFPATEDPEEENPDRELLLASYELDEDFYVLKETVSTEDKIYITELIFNLRYSHWYEGYPDDSGSEMIFILQINTWKDNSENSRVESNVSLFIYAAKDNYIEGCYLAKLIKKIRFFDDEDVNYRIYAGYEFKEVTSFGVMSKIPDSYFFISIYDRAYYPFQNIFDLIYCESEEEE